MSSTASAINNRRKNAQQQQYSTGQPRVKLSARKDLFNESKADALPCLSGTVISYNYPGKRKIKKRPDGTMPKESTSEKLTMEVDNIVSEVVPMLRKEAAAAAKEEREKEQKDKAASPSAAANGDADVSAAAQPARKRSEYLLSLISEDGQSVMIPINDNTKDKQYLHTRRPRWIKDGDTLTLRRFFTSPLPCEPSDRITVRNVSYNNSNPDSDKNKGKDIDPKFFYLNFSAPTVSPNAFAQRIGCDVKGRFHYMARMAAAKNNMLLNLDAPGMLDDETLPAEQQQQQMGDDGQQQQDEEQVFRKPAPIYMLEFGPVYEGEYDFERIAGSNVVQGRYYDQYEFKQTFRRREDRKKATQEEFDGWDRDQLLHKNDKSVDSTVAKNANDLVEKFAVVLASFKQYPDAERDDFELAVIKTYLYEDNLQKFAVADPHAFYHMFKENPVPMIAMGNIDYEASKNLADNKGGAPAVGDETGGDNLFAGESTAALGSRTTYIFRTNYFSVDMASFLRREGVQVSEDLVLHYFLDRKLMENKKMRELYEKKDDLADKRKLRLKYYDEKCGGNVEELEVDSPFATDNIYSKAFVTSAFGPKQSLVNLSEYSGTLEKFFKTVTVYKHTDAATGEVVWRESVPSAGNEAVTAVAAAPAAAVEAEAAPAAAADGKKQKKRKHRKADEEGAADDYDMTQSSQQVGAAEGPVQQAPVVVAKKSRVAADNAASAAESKVAPLYSFYAFGGGKEKSMQDLRKLIKKEEQKEMLLLRLDLFAQLPYVMHLFAVRNFLD
jgi:hypothetical protein